MNKVVLALFMASLQVPVSAGSIERALGGDRVAQRTLESLSTSDMRSLNLDSFIRGVEQLSRNPDLSSLPSVRVGSRTVSLDGLAPLIDMAKNLRTRIPSAFPALGSPTTGTFTPAPGASILTSPRALSPFASLESALVAFPIPASSQADLTRMVRSIKEFTSAE